MTLADTHCHLYMDKFDADISAVVARALAVGVHRMLVPGLDLQTSRRALELAREFESIYCAIGFHPTQTQDVQDRDLLDLKRIMVDPKNVAIGEIGLDYYWVKDEDLRGHQRTILISQLELSHLMNLPAVLHLREQEDIEDGRATRDLLAILRDWATELARASSPLLGRAGVLHSFSGSPDVAAQAIELGFYIGVTGPLTYPNAERRRNLVKGLPLDRILIETDAPFLAPQKHRGQRNEPAFVVDIADRIALIQSRTPADVAQVTTSNAARLFAWGEPD